MLRKYLFLLKRLDWSSIALVIFLTTLGLIAVYSIESTADDPDFVNFKKQLIFFGIGIVLLVFFSLLDYRYLKTYAWPIYIVGAVLLLTVLIFGTTIRGTKGWFLLFGDQGFQPVEMIKIVLILIISKIFYDWRSEIVKLKNLFIVITLAGLLVVLVLLQPDFGSAVILAGIFFGMLFIVKMKKVYIFWIVILLIAIFFTSWLFFLKDYQKERLLTFLDPSRDPWGSGYNIKQSIIAVGSGNILGRGLGLGPQSRLNFLPAQETDFIYAVIAEELGFVGSFLLIILIVLLVFRLIKIARLAHDDFGLFLICGIVIYFALQSVMNIGMNIGLLPIAGVPLPFVSYGGTSLIISFITIGIAQSVHVRNVMKL